jgi:hypothetical protein
MAIVFVSVFALDAFNAEKTIWQQIGDFLMHLIPSFVLIVVLLVAWKRELIGGIMLTLIGLGFSPFIFMHNYRMNQSVGMNLLIILVITIPFVIAGILFMVSYRLKKKQRLSTTQED